MIGCLTCVFLCVTAISATALEPMKPLPPSAKVAGKNAPDWSAAWWQWAFAQPEGMRAYDDHRFADAIVDADKSSGINALIAEGSYYGMQTFDQHLVSLIRDGVITLDAAMTASTNPHDLTVELRRVGLVA